MKFGGPNAKLLGQPLKKGALELAQTRRREPFPRFLNSYNTMQRTIHPAMSIPRPGLFQLREIRKTDHLVLLNASYRHGWTLLSPKYASERACWIVRATAGHNKRRRHGVEFFEQSFSCNRICNIAIGLITVTIPTSISLPVA